jgi:hypothetical protein
VNWVESVIGRADSVLCDCAHLVVPDVEVEDTVHVSARHAPMLASYALNQFQVPNETTFQFNAERGSIRIEIPPPVRLACRGMIPGNGHPYSWSAIINGYDPEPMSRYPYPVITRYLDAQPAGGVGIPNASVTDIWTEDSENAAKVAQASRIPISFRLSGPVIRPTRTITPSN